MKQLFILGILFTSFFAYAKENEAIQIRNILSKQVTEWNKGNIKGFMNGYWENDSLIFIGKNGPVYGFQSTLERYQKSYPDTSAMGKLSFELIKIKRLSKEYFFVIGNWKLTRTGGNLYGSYTLLFQKKNGKWVIICDHSS